MSFILLTTIVAILIVTIILYVKNIFSYWKKRGIPYIEPTFPFGNFKQLFLQKLSLAQMIAEIYKKSTEPLLGAFIAIQPTLIVRDPKIIRDILIKEFPSFSHRGTNVSADIDPMTNNLLMQNGDKWKKNRAKLAPAFTPGKLKGMFDSIVSCTSSLEEHIKKFADSGEIIEIRDVFARFGTNVIASVGFGIDVDSIKNPNCDFRQYGQRIFDPTITNAFRFNLAFVYPKLAKFLRLRFTDKDVGEYMIDIVRQNLEYREKNNVVRKDFFQLLMQVRNIGQVQQDDGDWSAKPTSNEKQMSLEEFTAHAYIFFVASLETVSSTISYCLYEMSKNQEVQSRACEEIETVLRKYDGKLSYESIGEMKYLGNCIDETLRLHTPFGFAFRQCTKDYKIPELNVVIKKGESVLIPTRALHMDPQYYDEPTKFMPERFDEKFTANKSLVDMPYLPFGNGPRICLAYNFAILQTKIALVLMLQKYQFELGPQHIGKELKEDMKAIAKLPVDGINLKVEAR